MSSSEFYTAIQRGDVTQVRRLLSADPELVSTKDPAGISPALVAMYAGHPTLADELAAQQPPLSVFEAAAFDDTSRLSELIEADPDLIGAWSAEGWQPLHLAALFGRSEAARLLLDADAFPDETSHNAEALHPLHLAAHAGHSELVWVLIASDAPVDAADSTGRTPLMLAAASGDAECIRALRSGGADPGLADAHGVRAEGYARSEDVKAMLA